jgi:WD40 repeat protein
MGRGRRPLGFVAIAALTCCSCYRSQELAIKHDEAIFIEESRLLLIDKRNELAVPGGPSIRPRVAAYDLRDRRELWRTLVLEAIFELSPRRHHAAVLGFTSDARMHLGLLELSKGTFRELDIWPPDPGNHAREPDKTSISDDGKTFASVLEDQLSLWDTTSTKLLYQQSFLPDHPRTIEFHPGSQNLTIDLSTAPAFDDDRPTLLVLARRGESWKIEKRIDDVRGHGWTTRGLLLSSPAGISRYDGHDVQLLVKDMKAYYATFSPDGRYVAYCNEHNALSVYDFDSGRIVLTGPWINRMRFHGKYVTTWLSGILWRGDLSEGKGKILRDFGNPSETVKIPFVGGTTTNTRYEYRLNDEGTRLWYMKTGRDPTAEVYLFD